MSISAKAYLVSVILLTGIVACKTKSKVAAYTDDKKQKPSVVKSSNISLHDKSLDIIKQHVEGQRWQLVYAYGGITGRDKMTYDNTYYTLTTAGQLITEEDGMKTTKPYQWKKMRDIFTGDSTYVVSGIVNWKVRAIENDTLRLEDNYPDGFGYSLIRAE